MAVISSLSESSGNNSFAVLVHLWSLGLSLHPGADDGSLSVVTQSHTGHYLS